MDTRSKKNPITGYMGYVPQRQQQNFISNQQNLRQSQIPGYVGYIPAVQPQNLYGKTYGKITQDCAKGNYSRGIQHSNDIKYNSTTKLTYKHPGDVKNQQLTEGKINGIKLSTFSSAAKLLMSNSGNFNQTDYTQQTVTNLTYQDACKKAYQ